MPDNAAMLEMHKHFSVACFNKAWDLMEKRG